MTTPPDPALDGLRGRRLSRLGGRPIDERGGRALLFSLDLGLDDGSVWRIERDDTLESGALSLRPLPGWEPEMPEMSSRAPWSGAVGAAIAEAVSFGVEAPRPTQLAPPATSVDKLGAWHFASLDAGTVLARLMLGLILETGAELMLTASGRSEAPALAPGVVILEWVL